MLVYVTAIMLEKGLFLSPPPFHTKKWSMQFKLFFLKLLTFRMYSRFENTTYKDH